MPEPALSLVAPTPPLTPGPARAQPFCRLNLGAGAAAIEGYDNTWDIKQGKKAYPLLVPDASCDEIRASHLFEHFSHTQARAVLVDWVRALKPGGLLKIAVPDFEYIAEGFLARRAEPWQGYLCGGHVDAHDVHLAQYDERGLAQLLRDAGLIGVHRWKGEGDCSALPVSLNLAAWKPPAAWPKVVGVMSVPRLGFMDNFFCATDLMAKMRMTMRKTTGAYWGQCITRAIELALEEGAEWVLTIDYDSLYTVETVQAMLATAIAHPEIDALVPLQMARKGGHPLMTVRGPDGKALAGIERHLLDATTVPIITGHFGLTLLRASKFASLAKPWFCPTPAADGGWGEGRIDDDIAFWYGWTKAGHSVHAALRCVIGHAELKITWPDINLAPLLQDASEFWLDGEPDGVWR